MEPSHPEDQKQGHQGQISGSHNPNDPTTETHEPLPDVEMQRTASKKVLARQRSSITESLKKKSSSSSTSSGLPTQQAVFVSKIGGPLRVADILIPKPGPGEVLIQIEAAPINPSDLQFITGHYVHLHPPFQIGLEGAGTVISSGGGSDADKLVDQRVSFAAAPTKPGSWAHYIVTQASNCFVLDKDVSFEHGSCGIINPLTAIAFIETLKNEKHKAIVRTAAASQLGRMMSKLLKKEGIRSIDIVRRPEQKKLLEDLGAEHVLCSEEEGFEENLKKLAEELHVTCLLECICGPDSHRYLKAMPKNCICYVYGHLAETELTKVNFTDILANNKTIKPFTFMNWFTTQGMFSKMKTVWKLQKLLLNDLKSEISKVFSIEEINEALQYYKEHMTEGKVIIKPQMQKEHSDTQDGDRKGSGH